MEKEFAPYNRALKLKELGFDEPCFAWYVSESFGLEYGKAVKSDLIKDGIVAPTFSQAFRWFREKHDLYSEVSVDVWSSLTSAYRITGFTHILAEHLYDFDSEAFNTYEEAELACLDKLIEIVELKEQDQ